MRLTMRGTLRFVGVIVDQICPMPDRQHPGFNDPARCRVLNLSGLANHAGECLLWGMSRHQKLWATSAF